MNLQRQVEIETTRFSTTPFTLGVNDVLESRLACISLLYRLGHIDDSLYLSLTVQNIQAYENAGLG